MYWYIIEKKSPPSNARVAFREVEEAFARVFVGGFVGLMGGFSAGGLARAGELEGLVRAVDKTKQYSGFIAEKSFERDKFLD